MTTPIRILIVEDDPSLRELLTAALSREGWEVMAAADANAGEKAAEWFHPDAAVLDIRLGEGPDGLTLARRLRQRSDLPFLFLTDAAAVEDRLAGFESGADDYLAKPFVLAELVARLRVVLRRRAKAAAEVIEVGPLKIDESGRRVFVDGQPVELTRIEFELLTALARQAGRVASKAQLLSTVWGFEGYDQNLVEVHVSSLRRKLGRQSSVIQTLRGVGYVLRSS
ncbi:MAG: two-component system, OmpR family, response regulator [Actinomycetota bacterium]|nr:two-component system, OmpR family, response regulator [Actinomycetota bacterium]